MFIMFIVLNNYNYYNYKNLIFLTMKARVVVLQRLAKANPSEQNP
jgi:hypothetical protein